MKQEGGGPRPRQGSGNPRDKANNKLGAKSAIDKDAAKPKGSLRDRIRLLKHFLNKVRIQVKT